MAKNITYLLGAGASAQCIPVVNGFGIASQIIDGNQTLISPFDRINLYDITNTNRVTIDSQGNFEKKGGDPLLDNFYYFESSLFPYKKTYLEDQSCFTLPIRVQEEYYDKVVNFHSFDTLARLYSRTRQLTSLRKLKSELAYLLSIYQIFKVHDKRYDLFLSTILDRDLNIPDNINIVSWNYDSQLQCSMRKFLTKGNPENISLEEASNKIGISSRLFKHSRPKIFCLNGTLECYTGNHSRKAPKGYFSQIIKDSYDVEKKKSFLKSFLNMRDRYLEMNSGKLKVNLFNAWNTQVLDGDEQLPSKGIFISEVKDILTKTDVLVVIGYSFPTFNRPVDRFILEDFIKNLNSKAHIGHSNAIPGLPPPSGPRVYIQDINAEKLKGKFSNTFSVAPNLIFTQEDVNEFLLPPEF